MPELTYDQTLNANNRTKAKLEIVLDPSITFVYATVPAVASLDGYKPATTTTRTPLFNAGGAARDFVSTRLGQGPQAFSTVAPPNNATVQGMITKATVGNGTTGSQIMARYTDANLLIWQGQAVLVYTGEQGSDVAGNTMYGFTVEWITCVPIFPT